MRFRALLWPILVGWRNFAKIPCARQQDSCGHAKIMNFVLVHQHHSYAKGILFTEYFIL